MRCLASCLLKYCTPKLSAQIVNAVIVVLCPQSPSVRGIVSYPKGSSLRTSWSKAITLASLNPYMYCRILRMRSIWCRILFNLCIIQVYPGRWIFMYTHVLEIFHWYAKVEVFISIHMYLAPTWARDMVMLMCICALSLETSKEIWSPGKFNISPPHMSRTLWVYFFRGKIVQKNFV